jgi:hypothetical protein
MLDPRLAQDAIGKADLAVSARAYSQVVAELPVVEIVVAIGNATCRVSSVE